MNKINWYINRLSLMSPTEIFDRARSAIQHKFESKTVKQLVIPQPDFSTPVAWYFDVSQNNVMQEIAKKHGWTSDANARLILAHRFSFFALTDHDMGGKINWHKDYKSGLSAPVIFSKSIDYRDSAVIGDIKYIWEPSRHLHIVTLAKAYYLTGNDAYKKEVVAQINDWIDANPYMMGVNWESSLELGIRLISWSWAWSLLGPIEQSFKEKWLKSIYQHCHFIRHHLSNHSSANNHLIGEVSGLMVGALTWPCWRESGEWRKVAMDVLVREMELQNYEDGVNKEQAVSYQQFVLDFFLLPALLAKANKIDFPEHFWKRIEAMLDYTASLMDVSGQISNIGDADDGYAINLSDAPDFNPYASLIATGAALFNRGDLKSKAKQWDEKSFWLLGPQGTKTFEELPAADYKTKNAFPQGGYYILSAEEGTQKEIKSVFDCGPLGYLSLAAHGHADALSFTLSVGGKEFLVDPGTYAYHSQKEWRNYFKGTSAHNTIRIDGQDQSLSGGNFMWVKKANAAIKTFENTPQYDKIIALHDGYSRLKDPVAHEREMVLDKQQRSIKIIDRISCKDRHSLEQFFHFGRDCIIEAEQGRYKITSGGQSIYVTLDPKVNIALFNGSLNPISGWQSVKFDVKHPSPTLRASFDSTGLCVLETVIEIL